jgi:hypothetical protein
VKKRLMDVYKPESKGKKSEGGAENPMHRSSSSSTGDIEMSSKI